jgi:hypothetical protein
VKGWPKLNEVKGWPKLSEENGCRGLPEKLNEVKRRVVGSEEIAPNLVSPLYNSAVTNPNFRVGPEITSNRNCQNLMNSRVVEKFFELEAA